LASEFSRAVDTPQRVEAEPDDGQAVVRRDRAVDVLRGLAIVLMITSHVGARSRVNTLLHLPLWIFALGLFVGLSGFVVGMRARATQTAGARGHLRRAGQLWLVHCVLTLSVLAIHELTGRLSAPSISELGGMVPALLGVLTLYVQPLDYMNILPLFIAFFAATPVLIAQLQRGRAAACLGVSTALWATSQLYPHWSRYTHPTSWPELGALAAWQLAFVLGVVLGHERPRLDAWLAGRRTALVRSAAAVVAAIFALAQLQRTALQSFGLRLPPQWQWLVSKSELGPVALVYMVGLLFLGYQALRSLARRHERTLDWFAPLETLGRRSLYAFLVHLPLALAASAASLMARPSWVQDVCALAALVVGYACARFHLRGRYIPR
jgi:hypothetical protein